MNRSHIKKFNILLMIILTLSLTACGEEKKKLNSCETYVKEQFQELYDAEVEVSEEKITKVEPYKGGAPEDVYSCKVNVAGQLYDTIVHIDKKGNMEMFTWYEDIFVQTICSTLGRFDYWYPKSDYNGRYWGLEAFREKIMIIDKIEGFDIFAEKLTQLDLDSFETAYFVRVEFLNKRINVPIRKEYTVEDYKEMLSELLPEVEMVEMDNVHELMFKAKLVNWTELDSRGTVTEVVGYYIYYDGSIEISVNTLEYSGTLIVSTMGDFEYSLLRNRLDEFANYDQESTLNDGKIWDIVYYDKSGNVIQSYCGNIEGSELLGEIFDRVLYSCYKKMS